jgi:hypothetical protein
MPEKLEPPAVKMEHLVIALRAHGLGHVVDSAEYLADMDTAKELAALAKRLPVTGDEVRETATRYRKRAEKKHAP